MSSTGGHFGPLASAATLEVRTEELLGEIREYLQVRPHRPRDELVPGRVGHFHHAVHVSARLDAGRNDRATVFVKNAFSAAIFRLSGRSVVVSHRPLRRTP